MSFCRNVRKPVRPYRSSSDLPVGGSMCMLTARCAVHRPDVPCVFGTLLKYRENPARSRAILKGHAMPWAKVKTVVNSGLRKLCERPYPNHSRGCPNYGKKAGCPPGAPLLPQTLDMYGTVYAIWNMFAFGEHVESMRALHPEWSQRQLACCLYWQGKARKQLRQEIECFHQEHGTDWVVCQCPEAQGANLTKTMRSIGIRLEWPPKTKAYQIVLAGKVPMEGGTNR